MKTENLTAETVTAVAEPKVHRGFAVLFFLMPITGVIAGVVSISGVTPHVVTSALFALIGVGSVLRPRYKITRLAQALLLLVIAWFVVTLLHIGMLNVPLTNEVTIALSGLAILLGVATVRVSNRTFDAVIVGWTFAYLLAAAVALMEKFLGFVPQNSYLVLRGYALETVGLSSLFGNPNGFGLFLIATSVVFMPFALSAKKPSVRSLYYALQLSTLYFMIESGSRTGLTCLAVVLIVTLWKVLHKRDVARALLILGVIALVIAQLLSPGGTVFINELRESSLFTDTDDGSFLLRFNLVRNGLMFLTESPLIGIGPDMYESYMVTRQNLYPTSFIINPHNGFIEILSQYGVIVFALFMFFLIRTGVSGWKLMRSAATNRDRNSVLGLAQLLLLVLLPLAATMHSTFLGAPAAWLYLCALLVLGRMATVDDPEQRKPHAARSEALPRRTGTRRRYA